MKSSNPLKKGFIMYSKKNLMKRKAKPQAIVMSRLTLSQNWRLSWASRIAAATVKEEMRRMIVLASPKPTPRDLEPAAHASG